MMKIEMAHRTVVEGRPLSDRTEAELKALDKRIDRKFKKLAHQRYMIVTEISSRDPGLPPETVQWLQWIEQKRQWKLRRGLPIGDDPLRL